MICAMNNASLHGVFLEALRQRRVSFYAITISNVYLKMSPDTWFPNTYYLFHPSPLVLHIDLSAGGFP